jgi:hypothetical protein
MLELECAECGDDPFRGRLNNVPTDWQLHRFSDPISEHTEFLTYAKKDKGRTKSRWADADWLQARRKLCDVIGEVYPIGVGAAVYVADYRDVRAAGK